jgi:thiamine kinase-like enzyme
MKQANPELRVRSLSLWKGEVSLAPLKGGLSNTSFIVTDEVGTFVARVGEDYPFHQVSREREAVASHAAHVAGLSPKVLFAEDGLMVVQHLAARTYADIDVQKNWRACVDILKKCHSEMPKLVHGQGAIFWVFQILRDYSLTLAIEGGPRSSEILRWRSIIDALEAVQVPLPIVFGHHDLLPSNFMDDGKRLWLIDWEYGAFGTAMFDLANLAAANGFDADLENQMLHHYFNKVDAELSRAFAAMKVAAALREAMWGMVSELHLSVPGVDYAAYADENLARFENIFADYEKRFAP